MTMNKSIINLISNYILKLILSFSIILLLNVCKTDIIKDVVKEHYILEKYDIVVVEIYNKNEILPLQKELTPNESGSKLRLLLKAINENMNSEFDDVKNVKLLISKNSKLNSI